MTEKKQDYSTYIDKIASQHYIELAELKLESADNHPATAQRHIATAQVYATLALAKATQEQQQGKIQDHDECLALIPGGRDPFYEELVRYIPGDGGDIYWQDREDDVARVAKHFKEVFQNGPFDQRAGPADKSIQRLGCPPDCEIVLDHQHCVWCPTGKLYNDVHGVLWNMFICPLCARAVQEVVNITGSLYPFKDSPPADAKPCPECGDPWGPCITCVDYS